MQTQTIDRERPTLKLIYVYQFQGRPLPVYRLRLHLG